MRSQKKGISAIIATIILVVITLVAAGMAAGFFYGLFGSQTSTANVAVTAVTLQSSLATTALAASGSTSVPSAGTSYIELSNSGTSSATVESVFLTWGGSTYSAVPTGTTAVKPGTPLYLSFSAAGAAPSSGEAFTGYALLQSGEQVIFSGTFA
jgi:flagellin-like protein